MNGVNVLRMGIKALEISKKVTRCRDPKYKEILSQSRRPSIKAESEVYGLWRPKN